MKWFSLVLVGSLLFVHSAASAALLVDEAPGAGTTTVYGTSYAASNVHGVAEDFAVPVGQVWSVSSVLSYFSDNLDGFDGKPLAFSIFENDGGSVGSQLFTAVYPLPQDGGAAWRGVSGLSWLLPAGEYWMGVQAVGDIIRYPHDGLPRVVHTSGSWSAAAGNNIGLRIEGTSQAAPEPAGILLLALALGAAAFARRRQARS